MTTVSSVIEEIGLDLNQLRDAIREEYQAVALNPNQGFHFHTGRPLARSLGYKDEWLADVPESAIESFAGTGNPFSLGELKPGYRVVDVASGAGIDSFIAAHKVGPEGYVVAVDMTTAMVNKARKALAQTNLTNLEFCEGYSEDLPVGDNWADVIISNGALNLMPDKGAALREMERVLKPNGWLQLADIIVDKPVSMGAKRQIHLWTGCIAGALLEEELRAEVIQAGFVDFEITWSDAVFDGAPQASNAASFGTVGVNFRARKPADESEWLKAMAELDLETVHLLSPQPILGGDAFYDAGDKGCAFGPIDDIASIVNGLASGQTLEVRATDPTVHVDLYAWARIAGHEVITEQGDRYLVRRS